MPIGDRFYNVNCLRSLGSRLQRAGRLEESLDIFQRWVDLYPNDPLPYFHLAPVLDAASRFEEALDTAGTGLGKARSAGDRRLQTYEQRFRTFEESVASKLREAPGDRKP